MTDALPPDAAPPDALAELPRPRPYHFHATLRMLALGRGDPTARVGPKEAWRATWLPSGPATAQLVDAGDRLLVRAWGSGAAEAAARAHGWLGLHDRPEEHVPDHPRLAALHAEYAGRHLAATGEVVHFLARNVVRQLVPWPDAQRYWRDLVRLQGAAAPGPGELLLPPAPTWLRDRAPSELRRLGLGGRQGDTLRRVGAYARRLEEAAALPGDERRRRLLALPGLGPWTVESTLGIGLGDPDAVPTGDYHLPNAVSWALAGEPRADDARMLDLLEPFRGQRWRVLHLLVVAGVHAPRFGPKAPLRGRGR